MAAAQGKGHAPSAPEKLHHILAPLPGRGEQRALRAEAQPYQQAQCHSSASHSHKRSCATPSGAKSGLNPALTAATRPRDVSVPMAQPRQEHRNIDSPQRDCEEGCRAAVCSHVATLLLLAAHLPCHSRQAEANTKWWDRVDVASLGSSLFSMGNVCTVSIFPSPFFFFFPICFNFIVFPMLWERAMAKNNAAKLRDWHLLPEACSSSRGFK